MALRIITLICVIINTSIAVYRLRKDQQKEKHEKSLQEPNTDQALGK